MRRARRPGKYSNKNQRNLDQSKKVNCTTCSSKACQGGKKCPGTKVECFECHKKGHFKGAKVCPKKFKKKHARRVESDDEDTSTDDVLSEPESSSPEESSDDEPKKAFRMKHVTKIRRMRVKRSVRRSVRRPSTSKKYQVSVVIKETSIEAVADTGADICIMSKRRAKRLGLKLQKTKMSIRPYGSKRMKCCGFTIVTVRYKERGSNIALYVINKDVETLLIGAAAEDLGILTFNGETSPSSPVNNEDTAANVCMAEETLDPFKRKLKAEFPSVFSGKVGKTKDYQVKYYVDEDVPPVAEPRRPIPYHASRNDSTVRLRKWKRREYARSITALRHLFRIQFSNLNQAEV